MFFSATYHDVETAKRITDKHHFTWTHLVEAKDMMAWIGYEGFPLTIVVEQGCKVVVLDFDMHMSESILKTKKIVSGLFGRHEDFSEGSLEECYVVHNSKAVVVKADAFSAPDKETIKQLINDVIERLRT